MKSHEFGLGVCSSAFFGCAIACLQENAIQGLGVFCFCMGILVTLALIAMVAERAP